MENSDSVLKQLKIIKRLVISIAVSAFILAGSAVYFSVELISFVEQGLLAIEQSYIDKKSSSEKVYDLFQEGKLDEAIKLATDHIKSHPYDEYAYYYRGLSYYHQKKWQLAIEDLNRTEELNPGWKEDHIKSYQSVAQAKLAKH